MKLVARQCAIFLYITARISDSYALRYTMGPKCKQIFSGTPLFQFYVGKGWDFFSNIFGSDITCYFFVWTDICRSFFLADIQGKVTWPLVNTNYLTFININSRANKQLSSILRTHERVGCTCSILKCNLGWYKQNWEYIIILYWKKNKIQSTKIPASRFLVKLHIGF